MDWHHQRWPVKPMTVRGLYISSLYCSYSRLCSPPTQFQNLFPSIYSISAVIWQHFSQALQVIPCERDARIFRCGLTFHQTSWVSTTVTAATLNSFWLCGSIANPRMKKILNLHHYIIYHSHRWSSLQPIPPKHILSHKCSKQVIFQYCVAKRKKNYIMH